ncbi:hypothetical protein [Achromobacter xylosoxidans]|uniref:hypothetical protein n=1 Tax=Alcaligenes xylosoxydans xylosoxydans TaxID=85698 RepID=UPI001FF32718|nr:hypothetical protein [Achromobacter xylosoxidans]
MLGLDDVAEKARRNLMIVSSGIWAVAFLGIPLDGKLVGAVDLASVQPWRAWLVASVALFYFGARYYYAPKVLEAWKPWASRRKDALRKEYTENLNWQTTMKNFRESSTCIDITWPYVPDNPAVYPEKTSEFELSGRSGSFQFVWDQSVLVKSFAEEFLPGEQIPSYPSPTLEARFRLKWRYYLTTQWRAFRQAYKLSGELLELTVPWLLAFGAAFICVCKLVASLYYSFPFVRQLLPA